MSRYSPGGEVEQGRWPFGDDRPQLFAAMVGTDADAETGSGPLCGVRVLEISAGMATRVAGMLLAELGADVVRLGGDVEDTPEGLCWDRGKLLDSKSDVASLGGVIAGAEGILTDGPIPPGCAGRIPVVVMAPYELAGPYADLHDDSLILAGVGGIASHHPAVGDGPVYPVVPTTGYIHGALGATALVASLVERRRNGIARTATITGLHACAAQMATIMTGALDAEVYRPGRAVRGAPNFRLYRSRGDEWFLLAALTPSMFVEALTALGCPELILLPGIDGDPANIMNPSRSAELTAAMETMFANGVRDKWLSLLAAGGIPSAPVEDRDTWLASDVLSGNHAMVQVDHPLLGRIGLPNVPIRFSATPGSARPLVRCRPPEVDMWAKPGNAMHGRSDGEAASVTSGRPLQGLQVIDMASFLAGPMAATILADMGADVIKLESPSGDPYRVFTLSYLAVNQRKRQLALDLRRPKDREAFIAVLKESDAVVENKGAHGLAKLGLPGRLDEINPQLVQCSVSAFGDAAGMEQLPGFDPVFQALGGMAVSQGGSWEPITTAMPVHDTAAGVLGALGIVAAIFARHDLGSGQRVGISLAVANTFLQSAELTTWQGGPPPIEGGVDFVGPTAGRRYYRAADGWLGVASPGSDPGPVLAALGVVGGAEPADGIAVTLAEMPVADAVERLRRAGVPAARTMSAGDLDDAFLARNGFTHLVEDPSFGRVLVVRSFSAWDPDGKLAESRSVPAGADNDAILGRS